jgi:hypothetical protein
MSDQTPAPADRSDPATARARSAFKHGFDRRASTIDRRRLALCALLLVVGCVRTAPPVAPSPSPAVWVDAYAPEGGDGGVLTALKRVPRLTAAAELHLRSGLYTGPFEFPAGTTVTGHGEAVLVGEDAPETVVARGPLALRHLSVQGGVVGLRALAPVTLDEVQFSGQRQVALDVADAGLDGRELSFTSRVPGVVGLRAVNAHVTLDGVRGSGTLATLLSFTDSSSTVKQVRAEGPAIVVLAKHGTHRLDGLTAGGGTGAAVQLFETSATVVGLDVTGHEYALLSSRSEATVDGVVSRGARFAGLAFVDSKVTLGRAVVERAGPGGGAQFLASTSTVTELVVSDGNSVGALVRKGKATFERLSVKRVSGAPEGDGLQVRDAEVRLANYDAEDLEGAALVATNFASVVAKRIEARSVGVSAAIVERRSSLVVDSLISRGSRGPSIAAPEDGLIDVQHLSARGGDVTVWAGCDTGSLVTIGTVDDGTFLPRIGCLRRRTTPRATPDAEIGRAHV